MNIINMSLIEDGIGMSLVGMLVVFSALVFLWVALSLISKALNANFKGKMVKKDDLKAEPALDLTGEASAAIAMALHLYLEEIHDQENTILTIKRYSKNYAPWSSKIYSVMGLNKRFHKKAS